MPDHELPASVRVALWATTALSGRIDPAEVAPRALPDLDDCTGLLETLTLWQSLGEHAVLVALPRPGDLTGLPPSGPELQAAAALAQECVYIPALGGALVPTLEEYGPVADRGWSVRWDTYPAGPVATHRVEALDLGQVELSLRTELAELTEQLLAVGGAPFGPGAGEGLARARSATDQGRWGLPEGIPGRAARLISLAGTVLTLTDAGLDPASESADLATTRSRAQALQQLQRRASGALADATNTAVLHLAGWR
ncbi:hypothetical protein ACI3EY_16120 [Ornithinimicrobium sp. LYQ92]|uniref:hypothetical protein n=1 Tax=Serinicoccus sp. LYQ92 TaxID=3378798 RepID=UPI00385446F6